MLILAITMTAAAQQVATVTWEASTETDINGYNVYVRQVSGTNDFVSTFVSGRTSTSTGFMANPYMVYEVYVSCVNTNGTESDPSNKLRFTFYGANGIGKTTSLTLLDIGSANFAGFQLTVAPVYGTLAGTPPSVRYTPTSTFVKDSFAYKSPELFLAKNITNFYTVYKNINKEPNVIKIN